MNHTTPIAHALETLCLTGALALACASTASTRTAATTPSAAQTAASTPVQVAQNNACNDWEVYFPTGSAEISPETRAVLERLAACIRNGDVREVSVVGSADPRGAATDNQSLGQRRADAIREVLVANGCAPSVVRAYSVGETYTSGSPDTYALERRVSVRTRERAMN
ncbi:MAG: OmpA family protein [Polyangiales bacterium]